MKAKHWMWVFALLSIVTMAYIWGNSLKSIPESAAQSSMVAELIRPILDPQKKLPLDVFHNLVRKLAHLVEFFTLGVFVCGFTVSLGVELKKRLISLPILIVLLVAVGDEFIQYFTHRGSLVTDVVLDFTGALGGLLATAILYRIVVRIKKK